MFVVIDPQTHPDVHPVQLILAPFGRIHLPNEPVAMQAWWVENFGEGAVVLFGHPPGDSPTLLCELAPGAAAEFHAAGVVFKSVDRFGATLLAIYR
jgi:hypothetical protein